MVENAFTPEQITDLNQLLDTQVIHQDDIVKPWSRFDRVLAWGKPLCDLIDNPRITPYLRELLSSLFRLDHDYVHIIRHFGAEPSVAFSTVGALPMILASTICLGKVECITA